ncbi:MAG: von Willebrand factor type A domain-containing protein [Proteobacteria bacterium]|nr:von Willebrand factor type A domain-containing protein [Pseudomonadota bacterium]
MKSRFIAILVLAVCLSLIGCDKETQPQAGTNDVAQETPAAPAAAPDTAEPAKAPEAAPAPAPADAVPAEPAPAEPVVADAAPAPKPTWVDELPEGYQCPKPVLPPPRPDYDDYKAMKGGFGGGAYKESAKKSNGKASPAPSRAKPAMKQAASAAGGGMLVDMAAPQQFNTEEFSNYDPNRFVNVHATPLSTFGADVDTASYSIFRRKVNEGRSISGISLRSEEMINYFKYDYPEPKAGEPFGVVTEISQCPWNPKTKLLQIGFQTHKLTDAEMAPSNIVFLLDVSGSMYSEDRLPLLKNALLNMLPDMFLRDRISIVTYASDQRLVLDGASAKFCRSEISDALNSLTAGGFTAGGRGIQMAYEVAEKNFIKGGNNRVILGTDGDLNVGISSTSELKAFIEKKRDTGIFLTVLGFGMGNVKDNRMEALADYGNGSYHYIDSILEARRVLVDERSQTLFVAAKDVKFQVEFNPAKIKGYRLIGYETRKLAAEDFADDTKDGGEVGAGHQVTMLYELVEEGSDVAVPEVKTKYQKQETVPSDEWLTVNVRYKEPDGNTSKLLSYPVGPAQIKTEMSENMKMAASVAAAAMIANDSPFKNGYTVKDVLALLDSMKSLKTDSERAEFRALVAKMNK